MGGTIPIMPITVPNASVNVTGNNSAVSSFKPAAEAVRLASLVGSMMTSVFSGVAAEPSPLMVVEMPVVTATVNAAGSSFKPAALTLNAALDAGSITASAFNGFASEPSPDSVTPAPAVTADFCKSSRLNTTSAPPFFCFSVMTLVVASHVLAASSR